jgi:hypothetical protein
MSGFMIRRLMDDGSALETRKPCVQGRRVTVGPVGVDNTAGFSTLLSTKSTTRSPGRRSVAHWLRGGMGRGAMADPERRTPRSAPPGARLLAGGPQRRRSPRGPPALKRGPLPVRGGGPLRALGRAPGRPLTSPEAHSRTARATLLASTVKGDAVRFHPSPALSSSPPPPPPPPPAVRPRQGRRRERHDDDDDVPEPQGVGVRSGKQQ